MHAADDFLRAIEAEPGDRTRRLVFADWLDERADPRGELIRVEEEMRTLPAFSDRFWELKPRRNELRAAAGPEWCGRMRYGTECEPVFRHGIPDGWRERWRLIREFTERWHRVPMPDVGGRQKEIAEAEARLGRALPPSVREWFAFAHDTSDERGHCLVHGGIVNVDVVPDPAFLAVIDLGQGHRWGIRADRQESDPVVCRFVVAGEHISEGEYVSGSVSDFIFYFIINHTDGRSPFWRGWLFGKVERTEFLDRLKDYCPEEVEWSGVCVRERDGVLVSYAAPASDAGLFVCLRTAPSLTEESLPDFLREFIRHLNSDEIPF